MLIRRARSEDNEAVHAVHVKNAGEFIWPRTLEAFGEMISAGEVFVASSGNRILGVCYVTLDEDCQRWEFGGVFVDPSVRSQGLGSILGRVALIIAWQEEVASTQLPLIAHVHENNPLPRGMLKRQLGFSQGGKETPPQDKVPKSLQRNAEGLVVADLFEFVPKTGLISFAEWLESGLPKLNDGTAVLVPDSVLESHARRQKVALDLRQQASTYK